MSKATLKPDTDPSPIGILREAPDHAYGGYAPEGAEPHQCDASCIHWCNVCSPGAHECGDAHSIACSCSVGAAPDLEDPEED